MQRTEVSKIGSISTVVFGCAAVGGRVSERASLRSMSTAFEAGVTTFDTARSYGYGDAEATLGKFLLGRRTRAEIITKAGIVSAKNSPIFRLLKATARHVFAVAPQARSLAKPALGRQHSGGRFDPRDLEVSLVASLRALRTDYVDALLLHACTAETVQRDEVFGIMERFVERGMARRVGVAAGAEEASLWCERGGEPTAELPTAELGRLRAHGMPGALWIANQPLAGGPLLKRTEQACLVHGIDPSIALEFLLQRPIRQGAHGVVLSMLSSNHAELAMAAVCRPRLQISEREVLETELLRAEPPILEVR